jgi:hypothetical protein
MGVPLATASSNATVFSVARETDRCLGGKDRVAAEGAAFGLVLPAVVVASFGVKVLILPFRTRRMLTGAKQ